ncbi:MAG: hypothetical protein KAJ28_04445 [Flavobacteriaceae bacterium]|nr:hypothetical protein [Flavobacteriaceae bacterium]
MKYALIIIFITLHLTLFSQSEKYVGKYEMRYEVDNGGLIEYKLTLNSDGTFLFYFYRNLEPSQPKENKYGKGVWKTERNNLIFFSTNKNNDFDEIHTLNFNNSKARYNSKSPRDNSERVIKTSLRFYSSEIFWVKGMKLIKKE